MAVLLLFSDWLSQVWAWSHGPRWPVGLSQGSMTTASQKHPEPLWRSKHSLRILSGMQQVNMSHVDYRSTEDRILLWLFFDVVCLLCFVVCWLSGFFFLSEVPVKCLNVFTSFLFVLSFWQPSWVFHDQGLCQDIINPSCVSRAVVWLFPSLRGDGLQPYQWLREKITSEDGRKQQAKLKELTHIAEKLGCTLPQLAIGTRKQNEPRGKTHITQHIVNVTATVSLLATVSLILWRSRDRRSSSVHLKQQMYISLCDFGCVCAWL